jgi:hypothetical protein
LTTHRTLVMMHYSSSRARHKNNKKHTFLAQRKFLGIWETLPYKISDVFSDIETQGCIA